MDNSRRAQLLHEVITANRTIASMGLEDYFQNEFEQALKFEQM